MNQSRTILAVLAHPDDETFGIGGTLALYAKRGVKTVLICATRGEAGEADDEHLQGFGSIAELRESELRCAAKILGLKEVYFLDYRDSGMSGAVDNKNPDALIFQPLEKVAGEIVKYIRQLRPEIVITFDPIGGYHHPDHIQVHKATTLAFAHSGDVHFHPEAGIPYSPRGLYYHTIPNRFLKGVLFFLRLIGKDPSRFGKNGDIDLVAITAHSFPVHAQIKIRGVMKKKDTASRCHSSQGGRNMSSGVLGWLRYLLGGSETFMRAYPPVKERKYKTNDLFTY